MGCRLAVPFASVLARQVVHRDGIVRCSLSAGDSGGVLPRKPGTVLDRRRPRTLRAAMDCTKTAAPESRTLRVLFLCTHNACRSQMAEGLLNARLSGRYAASSAGTTATAVHPLAIRVLAEVGVDISHHTSKSLALFLGESFDVVVTVCDDAGKTCPAFPGGGRRIHRSFADPSRVTGSEEAILDAFRRTRDEIDAWILETFAAEAVCSCNV